MHSSVGEPRIVYYVHTDPNVDFSKYFLLVLLILTSMVEEESVEEILFSNFREKIHFNRGLTITA
jgi:hypothetical protein